MAKAKTDNVAEVQEEAIENAQEAMEQGVPAPESISLNDLQLLLNIVDLASKRGAFGGSELTQVGAIFDKLSAFLGFVAEQQSQEQEGEEAEAPAQE